MKWWRVVRARIAGLFASTRFGRELDDELQFHLRSLTEEKIQRGLSPADAKREALLEFGNVAAIKNECREVGAGGALEAFVQDLQFAARNLWKQKSFAATAIIALVLGIGANTALFTVLSATLLRPMPFPEPERLVAIWSRENTMPNARFPLSYPDLADLRQRNQSFEAIGGYRTTAYVAARPDHSGVHVRGAMITHEILHILGARPTLGRAFRASDEEPGARSVIISDKLWREEFAAASDCLGTRLLLDGDEYFVIGVMPADFRFPIDNDPAELWTTPAKEWDPLAVGVAPPLAHRDGHYFAGLGRLRSGVTRAEAEADLNKIAQEIARKFPETSRTIDSCFVVPFLRDFTREIRPVLLMLSGAAACFFCVACTNVANLLLARGTTRMRDISLHVALGAGRERIRRQLLGESFVLGIVGAAGGLVTALMMTHWIVALLPSDFPRRHEIAPDLRVLAFAVALALAATVLGGLAPALRFVRLPLTNFLKDATPGSTETLHAARLRNAFVIAQFALTFLLLAGALVMLRSIWRVEGASPGFQPENLMTATVSLPDVRDSAAQVREATFYSGLIGKLNDVGGVESATAVAPLPFTNRSTVTDFEVLGTAMPKVDWPRARPYIVTPRYFRTMQIPLVSGRDFDSRDQPDAEPVVIVNESLARTIFPNQDCIGKQIRPGIVPHSGEPPMRKIVGVVRDVRYSGAFSEARAELYLPHTQCATTDMTIAVRSQRAPADLADDIDWAVHSLDRTLPVYDKKPMTDYGSAVLAGPRLNARLLATFAAFALMLSGIGVYGLMAFSFAQRRREIGIRLAFGAPRDRVLRLLVAEAVKIAAWSLLFGAIAAAPVILRLKKFVNETGRIDVEILTAAALLLVIVALAAAWLPAQRAATENPLNALGER